MLIPPKSAHLVPHVVAIQLHEPFADLNDPSCNSGVRLLTEARACLKIVYLLVGSSADISYVVAPITSCKSSLYITLLDLKSADHFVQCMFSSI